LNSYTAFLRQSTKSYTICSCFVFSLEQQLRIIYYLLLSEAGVTQSNFHTSLEFVSSVNAYVKHQRWLSATPTCWHSHARLRWCGCYSCITHFVRI